MSGDGILHRHLSELGSPCAPVLPPNLSGATAIPGVIPFDGERSRDPPSRRDRNATHSVVFPARGGPLHPPEDPQAVRPEPDVTRRTTALVGHGTTGLRGKERRGNGGLGPLRCYRF